MSKRGHTKKPSQMADVEIGRTKPEAKRMAAENMKNETNMRKNRQMNNMTIEKMRKMNGTRAGQRGAGARAAATRILNTPGSTFHAHTFTRMTRHPRHGHGTRFPGLSMTFFQPSIQMYPCVYVKLFACTHTLKSSLNASHLHLTFLSISLYAECITCFICLSFDRFPIYLCFSFFVVCPCDLLAHERESPQSADSRLRRPQYVLHPLSMVQNNTRNQKISTRIMYLCNHGKTIFLQKHNEN